MASVRNSRQFLFAPAALRSHQHNRGRQGQGRPALHGERHAGCGLARPLAGCGLARPLAGCGLARPLAGCGLARPLAGCGLARPLAGCGLARPLAGCGLARPFASPAPSPGAHPVRAEKATGPSTAGSHDRRLCIAA